MERAGPTSHVERSRPMGPRGPIPPALPPVAHHRRWRTAPTRPSAAAYPRSGGRSRLAQHPGMGARPAIPQW